MHYEFLIIITAYLIGSVNFSIILSWAFNINDPRTYGSANPGATNMLRSKHPNSKKIAGLTFFLDALKGLFALIIAAQYGQSPYLPSLCLLACVVGHLYPIFHKFQGGKGVSTLFGTLLGFHAYLFFAAIGTWALLFVCFKRSSVSAMMMLLVVNVFVWATIPDPTSNAVISITTVLIAYRHKDNIKRLLNKEENRVA